MKSLDINYQDADHLADFLLGQRTDKPKPIYTPMTVQYPKGFRPDYRNSETLPLDEDGDPRQLTRDEKHYLPANEDERGE